MNKMKKMKALKILGLCILVVAGFLLIINIIPPKKFGRENVFINQNRGRPMLAAHRGGAITNPENTLKAYQASVNQYNIDIVESDIWLTKDGKIVFSHDGTIDRMSDVSLFDTKKEQHEIGDYTLEELQEFNFGYGFKDKNGNYPYKNLVTKNQPDRRQVLKENGLQILEVESLFEEFYTKKPDLLFIVEIKNPGEKGYEAVKVLNDLLTNKYPEYKKNVVIGTFHNEIAKELKEKYPDLLRGASTGDAISFIVSQLFGVNLFSKADFACLQIPTSYNIKGIKLILARKTFINRAHRRNIAVQYWTINTAEEMRQLAKIGCDCIMTDDPEIFIEVAKEWK